MRTTEAIDAIKEAIDAIKAGKVLVVPTDTFYGFACDACSAEGRSYEIKGHKLTSPLAICVADVANIPRFATADHLPIGLLVKLLPGPITVVSKRVGAFRSESKPKPTDAT
ncbi:YrdC domain-containing protein [Carex littledalei]|uniref:Threonylcarbamoyl-AMP synthase n=1 Tax=Carex littledalei TaxID=544730 RepID=A0A833RGR4_9POAL|nr:YrdC domain-containing protein [Carex littledalei]